MVKPTVLEEARTVPVIDEADVCVLGGSCTGVFAAIRAARLGARVVLVERMGCFGGVATLSLVNVWHSPLDEVFEQRIIGGLTVEVMDRLARRDAVTKKDKSPHWAWAFNPFEMQIELDELVREHGIQPWLHTAFAAPLVRDGRIEGVFVENKSGRGLIRARQFIDATGDGDLCSRLGLETRRHGYFQPATTCALFDNWNMDGFDLGALLRKHGPEHGLAPGFQWGVHLPGSPVYMLAGTRIRGADCSDGRQLTDAEIEGRRQVRAILDVLRAHAPERLPRLAGLAARLGIRESRHVRARAHLTGDDVLSGRRFRDAIANGSYRVDIHYQDKSGLEFRYLDGRRVVESPGEPTVHGRWRPVTGGNPTFYQIPFGCLVPQGPFGNLLAAGRMIDVDEIAHSAVRVMVNMNQTGEAAGVAAVLALRDNVPVATLDPGRIRAELTAGGSIVL
jgi:glycine/D-amino acid oxidase-like deaminating enzyme